MFRLGRQFLANFTTHCRCCSALDRQVKPQAHDSYRLRRNPDLLDEVQGGTNLHGNTEEHHYRNTNGKALPSTTDPTTLPRGGELWPTLAQMQNLRRRLPSPQQ